MTLDEAEKIARIIGTADNACSNCVNALIEKLNNAFPEFKWTTKNEIKYEYFAYTDDKMTTWYSLGHEVPKEYDYFESWIEVEVKPG